VQIWQKLKRLFCKQVGKHAERKPWNYQAADRASAVAIADIPARVVRSPKLVHDEHFRLALDEISRRETHFKPHKFWKLLTIFLSLTAIRRAQIVGMKWCDLMLEDAVPHIVCARETSKTQRRYPVALCKLGVELMREWRSESTQLWGDSDQFLDSTLMGFAQVLQKETLGVWCAVMPIQARCCIGGETPLVSLSCDGWRCLHW
jgi:integrase